MEQALRRITDRLRENGYRPLWVGAHVFDMAYSELKAHEELIDKWQRYAPAGAIAPTLMVANTAVELDPDLPPDAIDDRLVNGTRWPKDKAF